MSRDELFKQIEQEIGAVATDGARAGAASFAIRELVSRALELERVFASRARTPQLLPIDNEAIKVLMSQYAARFPKGRVDADTGATTYSHKEVINSAVAAKFFDESVEVALPLLVERLRLAERCLSYLHEVASNGGYKRKDLECDKCDIAAKYLQAIGEWTP